MVQKYLNFFVCWNVTPFVWKKYWTGCLNKHITSVLAVLLFIPTSKHASEDRSSAYWRSFSFELNNARSSTNSRRQTLHSPSVTPLEELSLSILKYIINKRGERTQPCRSLIKYKIHKIESFAFVYSSYFSTTDRQSWCITALAFPIQVSISLFTITRECDSKIIKLLRLPESYSICLKKVHANA